MSRDRAAELHRVALVVGTTAGGTGAHVRMLAAGLARRGIAVSVFGPVSAAPVLGVASLPGVGFTSVEFGDRPRPADAAAVLRLRRALRAAAAPDVVHAHGLRAGALTVLALAGARRRRPAIVVTVHNAPPHGGGAAVRVYQVLERAVARGADLVLCVSPDLEQRMRAAGARRVGRAVVPAPDMPAGTQPDVRADGQPAPDVPADGPAPDTSTDGHTVPATPATQVSPAALAARAPIVLAAGRLAPQKGFGVLLEAAARWRDLEPAPLLVIAGDGPLAGELRSRAAALGVRAEFPGRLDDIPALLASAAVFVLPSLWEGQPLVLQEALRAGVPVVATHTGGIADLTGDDAALLVPPGDPARLADAVRSVLRDPALNTRLRAAARERGAALPSEDDAVAAVLACYAYVARVLRLGY